MVDASVRYGETRAMSSDRDNIEDELSDSLSDAPSFSPSYKLLPPSSHVRKRRTWQYTKNRCKEFYRSVEEALEQIERGEHLWLNQQMAKILAEGQIEKDRIAAQTKSAIAFCENTLAYKRQLLNDVGRLQIETKRRRLEDTLLAREKELIRQQQLEIEELVKTRFKRPSSSWSEPVERIHCRERRKYLHSNKTRSSSDLPLEISLKVSEENIRKDLAEMFSEEMETT